MVAGGLRGIPESVQNDVLEPALTLEHEICAGLEEAPPDVEPMFWETKDGHVIAMDWCEAFMQAVSMQPRARLRLTENGSHGKLMPPVLCHLVEGEGNSVLGIPQDELAKRWTRPPMPSRPP